MQKVKPFAPSLSSASSLYAGNTSNKDAKFCLIYERHVHFNKDYLYNPKSNK